MFYFQTSLMKKALKRLKNINLNSWNFFKKKIKILFGNVQTVTGPLNNLNNV